MSGEPKTITLNGAKWPLAIVVTLLLNLVAVVWGASSLNTRVGVIELDHVHSKENFTILRDTVSNRGQTIAVMGTKIDRIDRNVQSLLDD